MIINSWKIFRRKWCTYTIGKYWLVLAAIYLMYSVLPHIYNHSNKKRVLIVLPSLLTKVEQRSAVRTSWGDFNSWPYCEVTLQLLFYVGKPRNDIEQKILSEEMYTYGDMVELPINEGYYNLTNKVIETFKHAVSHNSWMWFLGHRYFDYIIKTDDDTFVNLPVICPKYGNMSEKNVYGGLCHATSQPVRFGQKNKYTSAKFAVTNEEFSGKFYPHFCEGAFYYMSKDMAAKLVEGFKKTKFFKFEDVFVGMAFKTVNVKFGEDIEKNNSNFAYLASRKKDKGLQIEFSEETLRTIWAFHPVMESSRFPQIQKVTIDLHKCIRFSIVHPTTISSNVQSNLSESDNCHAVFPNGMQATATPQLKKLTVEVN